MNNKNDNHTWEKRWHPLLKEWVIIASQTSGRPWSGAVVNNIDEKAVEFDPGCYLCPGVKRASGASNPDYQATFAFDNDFASFALHAPEFEKHEGLYKAESAKGICRVICFSPKHNIVLAQLSINEITEVIKTWINEFDNLSKKAEIKYVMIFENKGKVIGVSNPHPHGQIYATGFIPRILLQEVESGREYYDKSKNCLFCDILKEEKKENKRIVALNNSFTAFVPYFARFSYEINIFSNRHFSKINQMDEKEVKDFADILKRVLCRYDNLFGMIMPNILMMHNAPVDGGNYDPFYHFHMEFYPPLRSPDKLKYLAGFESGGGNIINPTDPDFAAGQLKRAGDIHFRNR
jgi:UDPglucose--hexose-1-phosphate uridylyltransferase